MNIYFCGIGGVGLGPLAEIAHDAGHTVQGSDATESLMTQRLTEQGITINNKQKGVFLQTTHNMHPIDWFVYSSGIPEDHPELALAKMLGIKMSKRDELLQYIIDEKNLNLIAIAGTHGKTTTSAMTVWVLQQLNIPVSYSIGTTMSFGPSGHYEPNSQYFVYECDEFDRNFLHFHPFLSLITSLDYDHPDTYGSPDDYIAAFRQFLTQSDGSILWQSDANLLGEVRDAWLLGDHDIEGIQLPGEHNRRNASLVIKAMERLNITGDAIEAMNRFPGVDRRFEKIGTNLYTDYGHHPTEIAATLQLARELSDDVVLVYQPHQNLRQHELRTQYTDCFEQASDIYWLPTYLTREDPAQSILTPDELIENITNRDAVHVAELDDKLWEHVQRARDRGALVLAMGAGSIDAWVREKIATKHVVKVLIMDQEGNFILQQNDTADSHLSAFGSDHNAHEKSLLDTAIRILHEQSNLEFAPEDLAFLKLLQKVNTDESTVIEAYYVLAGVDVSTLQLPDGKKSVAVNPNELSHYPVTIDIRSAIAEYTHPLL